MDSNGVGSENKQQPCEESQIELVPTRTASPCSLDTASTCKSSEVAVSSCELGESGKKGSLEKSDENLTGLKEQKDVTADDNVIVDHTRSIQEVSDRYGSRVNLDDIPASLGLTEERATALLSELGPNCLTPPKRVHPIFKFIHLFCGLFNLMLTLAGILCFVLYFVEPEDQSNLWLGIILVVVCFLNTLIEFYQEFKSSKMLESFLGLLPANCLVTRDGVSREIGAAELVPGDIVTLRNGEKVPADMRLISCSELKVDNSSLTGESEPLERSLEKGDNNPLESSNLVFYGTMVVNGQGQGIVILTGDRTVLGSIADLTVNEVKRESQLTAEITLFVRKMAAIAITLASIFFTVAMVLHPERWASNFAFAIGVLVSFVPQGLPLTVTFLLTIAAKRLASLNVLVKDLQGVETLGSITLLASDKTGTLTQNKMTVMNAWINLEDHFLVQNSNTPPCELIKTENLNLLTQISCLCSKAQFDETDADTCIESRRVFGDATETGLLRFAASSFKGGCEYIEELHQRSPKVFEVPFNSSTKWHMTFHRIAHANGKLTIYLKGAPERIVGMCSSILVEAENSNESTVIPWEEEKHTKAFYQAYESYANQGQRVIAFAMMQLDEKDYPEDFNFVREPANFPLTGFTFVGLMSLMDPPKRGVRKAVAACKSAGIQVVMVTGDHPLTAEAIARKIGLILGETANQVALRCKKPVQMVFDHEYDAVVIHGDKIDKLSDEDWDRILSKKEIVFARTAPHHKLMIVERCQGKGHIVGVSGDGVNDSPALKKADLGISMNLTGSDVSKEAAAMILLDDNFASIVVGINQGRLIFANLKKSIRYTLTHVVPEAIAFFLFIIFGIPLPLSSILILFIDLGTELLPAISYAWEGPDGNLMLLPPRKVLCTPQMNYATFDANVSGSHGNIGRKPSLLRSSAGTSNDSYASNATKTTGISKLTQSFKNFFKSNETGEILVDNDLLRWSYIQGGLFVSLGCFLAYLVSLMVVDGLHFSELSSLGINHFNPNPKGPYTSPKSGRIYSESEQRTAIYRAQAAYFAAIVVGQWFTLFLCKKQWDICALKADLFRNRKSLMAVLFGAVFTLLIIYVPGIQILGTANVSYWSWLVMLATGICYALYEALRKFMRKRGFFGGVPKNNINLLDLVRTTSTC